MRPLPRPSLIPNRERLPLMDRARSPRRLVHTMKVERQYASQLRKIATHIGELINTIWVPDDPAVADQIGNALERYAQIIEPWAHVVGRRMVEEIDARDRRAWREVSAEMSQIMQAQLHGTDVGSLTRQRLADQVQLITSLPRDAAERVHKLTLEGLTQGTRANEIAAEIMRSGQISKSRANLIARTEVARTSTEFTRARAEDIGSTHFIWRTSRDSDVRPTHKALDGKTFRWDEPPECDPGHHALPGAIWNCRCFAEPVF